MLNFKSVKTATACNSITVSVQGYSILYIICLRASLYVYTHNISNLVADFTLALSVYPLK